MIFISITLHFSRGALGDIFLACSPALWVSGCPIQSFIILNFRSSPAGIHTHFVDPGAGLPTADSRLPTIPCPPHYSPFSACSPPIARPRCRPTCWWSVFCVLDVDAVAMCSWDAGPLGSRIFWGSRLSLGGNGVVRRREWGCGPLARWQSDNENKNTQRQKKASTEREEQNQHSSRYQSSRWTSSDCHELYLTNAAVPASATPTKCRPPKSAAQSPWVRARCTGSGRGRGPIAADKNPGGATG